MPRFNVKSKLCRRILTLASTTSIHRLYVFSTFGRPITHRSPFVAFYSRPTETRPLHRLSQRAIFAGLSIAGLRVSFYTDFMYSNFLSYTTASSYFLSQCYCTVPMSSITWPDVNNYDAAEMRTDHNKIWHAGGTRAPILRTIVVGAAPKCKKRPCDDTILMCAWKLAVKPVQSTARPKIKRRKKIKVWKLLSRICPVQYSPRRWVLADYGGKDLWKRWVLSL